MKIGSASLFAALALASSACEAEEPRITRVFCWGYPADEVTAERYAAAGVTDITVRSRKEYDLAVKYGMTPYCGIFYATGPHRPSGMRSRHSGNSREAKSTVLCIFFARSMNSSRKVLRWSRMLRRAAPTSFSMQGTWRLNTHYKTPSRTAIFSTRTLRLE